MKKYLTLLKRECWENRFSFFIAPVVISSLLMLLAMFLNANDYGNGQIGLNASVQGTGLQLLIDPDSKSIANGEAMSSGLNYIKLIDSTLLLITSLLAAYMLITFTSYALTCLQDERKGNSMLFWNSFPVSHTQAVLVKLFTASALLPLITFITTILTQVLIVAVVWLRLIGTDIFAEHVWPNLHLYDAWLAHAVNIFVFALGSLSAIGLLLTISATGYRAFILFALTLLSLAVITFLISGDGTTVIRFLLTDPLVTSTTLFGYGRVPVITSEIPISLFSNHTGQAIKTLHSYSFWLAIFIGCMMVIAAIIMRRYRSEV